MASKAAFASGVIAMLKEDHQTVKGLFEAFESAEGQERADLTATAIMELELHAELEATLIYPAIREQIEEDDMMNAAVEEHHLAHVLMKELKKLKPNTEIFQAKFKVRGEVVKHHSEEEESEMLPQAESRELDWESVESRVLKRKEALIAKGTGRGKRSTRSF